MSEGGDGDYDVGYAKPPKHTRWPSGVSGNPKGKEKGKKGLKTDLDRALNTVATIENKLTGKRVKGRNQKHAIDRLVDRAALGDLKAQAILFPMIKDVLGVEDRGLGPRKLSTQDQALLDELLASRAAEAGGREPEPEAQSDGDGDRRPPPPDAPTTDDNPED